MENLVRRAAPEDAHIDDALVQQCLEVYKGEYEQRWNAKTRPYDGITEVLGQLAAAGLPMGVLSNKLDVFTKKCIAEYFPGIDFVAVFGQRDGIAKKPDPTAALEIGELMGLSPAEIAFVDDSSIDMRTAVAAGMLPVGVS